MRALLLLPLLLTACATPRASSGPAPRELRVLVYNVHAGKDAAGVDNLERVAALVRETRADVALLQELDVGTRRSGGVDQPAVLARGTGMHVAFGRTLDFQGGQYGIGVLSRWPVASHAVRALPVEPPQARSGGSYEPRGALHARIAAPWGALHVVNTHLDASRDDGWRRQEIRTVVALADSLRRAGGLVLVGGDFNSEPGSAVQAAAAEGGLRDAWLLCGQGPALTYPAGKGTKRIDYLYLPAGATCSDARVLGSDASDHAPLLVVVKLEP